MNLSEKRIMLRTTTGPLAGLRRIMGTTGEMYKDLGVRDLPTRFETVDFGSHQAPAVLSHVGKNYVAYTESPVVAAQEDDGA